MLVVVAQRSSRHAIPLSRDGIEPHLVGPGHAGPAHREQGGQDGDHAHAGEAVQDPGHSPPSAEQGRPVDPRRSRLLHLRRGVREALGGAEPIHPELVPAQFPREQGIYPFEDLGLAALARDLAETTQVGVPLRMPPELVPDRDVALTGKELDVDGPRPLALLSRLSTRRQP